MVSFQNPEDTSRSKGSDDSPQNKKGKEFNKKKSELKRNQETVIKRKSYGNTDNLSRSTCSQKYSNFSRR